MAFIDLQKAYDSVDRKRLWESMRLAGLGGKMAELMEALYEDEVIVQVDGEEVGTFGSKTGVRQGCIVSPLMFNVVLQRAVESAMPEMKGIEMRGKEDETFEVRVVAYADDMVVMAESIVNV